MRTALVLHRQIEVWARRHLLYILIALQSLAACSTGQGARAPASKVIPPPGVTQINSVALLPTGQLVISDSDNVWYRNVDENAWQRVSFGKDSDCLGTRYFQLDALPDGRVGMLKLCTGAWQDSAGRLFHTKVYHLAYDFASDTVAPLVAGVLPDSGQFTWKPDMSKGMFATIGAYSTLYWLTATGTTPLTITLTDGAKSWTLPDSIAAYEMELTRRNQTGRELHSVGMVSDPTWSPNGQYIAFWATLETIGQPWNFPVVPWDMYLLNPDTFYIQRVQADVYDPHVLTWSPDGQWLAYVSGPGSKQAEGMWLFSLRTRTSTLIEKGNFADVTWSSDGHTIIAIKRPNGITGTTEIWNYEVSTIMAFAK